MFIELAEKILNGCFACIPRTKPDTKLAQNVKLIAHRGAHSKKLGIIENTMISFTRAKELGCWGIELDVHATKDKVIVVNHDPDLKRLWKKNATIASLTFKELRELAPNVPTLEEVIQQFGDSLHWFIELKEPFHAEEALLEALKNLKPCQDYHLLSLDEPLFARLKHFPKEAMLLVPMHNNVNSFCELTIKKGYAGVLANYFLLTDRHVRTLLASKQLVGVGFINSRNSLYRELKRPIPWIFSDNVDVVRESLDELNKTLP